MMSRSPNESEGPEMTHRSPNGLGWEGGGTEMTCTDLVSEQRVTMTSWEEMI